MQKMINAAASMSYFPGFIAFRFSTHDQMKELQVEKRAFLEHFKVYDAEN